MSEIGEIYGRYHEALENSLQDFSHERRSAFAALKTLYQPVLSRLIRNYDWIRDRTSPQWSRTIHNLRDRYGTTERSLQFAAIDGTCGKELLSEMVVFYGGSYAQQGELLIDGDAERLEYRRWSPSQDTSVVAYLPVPLTGLESNDDDWMFRVDDIDRSAAAVAHTSLMQLAEIYLAYRRVTEDAPPRIVLLDHSLSSILLSSDVMHLVGPFRPGEQVLGWIGAQVDVWGRPFEAADALVAHAHPMDGSLAVPSWRYNALAECLVARLTDFWRVDETGDRDPGRALTLDTILSDSQFPVSSEDLKRRIIGLSTKYRAFELQADRVVSRNVLQSGQPRTLRQRWYDLRRLFENVGNRLFRERRLESLQLSYVAGTGRRGPRWMDTNDLKFLIGLGLRLLIETCWRKRILLLGIAKDSASRYFSRNYLSILHTQGILHVPESGEPPGSDRIVCEMIPLIDESVGEPWSTVEFDGVFMTLRAVASEHGLPRAIGVKGNVLVPSDGLFAKSLVQMFLRRRPEKDTPLMGHVLFLDRLADPQFDSGRRSGVSIETRDTRIRPLYSSHIEPNPAQDIAMLVAFLLTRNCFPEAIGQPDPLHRADLGAKALGKRIDELVRCSMNRMRANPLAWTFRDYRSMAGGH